MTDEGVRAQVCAQVQAIAGETRMWFRRNAREGERHQQVGHGLRSRAGRPVFEALERKEMLSADAPQVLDIVADNRGFVQIVLDSDLNNLTVNQNSVRFFEAGDDGLLGTEDDVAVNNVAISYNFGDRTITADASILAGTAYSVVLDGSLIRGVNGCFLDGEFNGSGTPSGDGVEGGDTQFFARATGATIARINTNLGVIDIELFPGQTPITVANFLRYANERLYDGVFFHRSASLGDGSPFVIQGGGFEADLPFLPIPVFDPILNEPGISNLRGTIAVAKLGGNPNSGTSQWFFNLGDNSANLDNQNGGFTVFGEVLNEESLAVVDAIAALDTFDASVTSSAFNEVPVIDLDLINDTSGVLMMRDIVRIDRVSQLLVVSQDPFGQIDTDEVRTVQENGNDARVTLFSLTGAPLGVLSDFLRVNFGPGNSIQSITFTSTPPAPVGLQITGASNVGSITERRNGGSLGFIVSNVGVNDIRLKTAITGFALNGVLLADNVLLPEDIDGDNRFDDNTSILVSSGTTRSLRLDNGLSGDIIMPGGLISLTVKGDASMSDIRTGANVNDVPMDIQFDRVRDVVVDTQAPVRNASADGWSPFLTQNASFTAPSLETLRIKGDFGADLRLTDPTAEAVRLIQVTGDVLRSDWNIAGSVDRVRFDGATGWTVFVGGDALILRGNETRNFTFTAQGENRTFRVTEVDGGVITLGGTLKFNVARGDFIGDLTVGAQQPGDVRSFKIGGDLLDSNVTFATDVRNFTVKGDIDETTVNGAAFRDLKFKAVTDSTFVATGAVRQLRVTSWEGGLFQASEARAIRTIGDRRTDNPGDFAADLTVSNAAIVRIAGDIRDSDFRVADNRDFRVGGDILDSEVRFFRLFVFATIAANDIAIEGSIIGSQIYAGADVRTIRTDAMLDSAIYIGSTGNLNGFAAPNQINATARIEGIIIRGEGPTEFGFQDSFIVGGHLEYVRLTNPDFRSTGPFGIAGQQIDRVEVLSTELTRGFTSPNAGVVILDDLEIRPGFQAPV